MNSFGVPSPQGPAGAAGRLLEAKLPWLAAGVLVAIQFAVELAGGYQFAPWWFETFGLRRSDVFQGRIWQPVTYALLHGSWVHVAINGLGILLLGARVEQILGGRGFVQVLLWSVFGGGVGHLLLAPGGANAATLVGASGACVGLLLVITTLSPESRMWPLPVSGRSLGAGILMSQLALALVHPGLKLPGLASIGRMMESAGLESWFQIGHACHFGGGLAGWLWGRWLLRPRISRLRLRQERDRREARERMG